MKKAIIGIEIEIREVGGKFKMSQELKDGDCEGVIEGFNKLGIEEGAEIVRLVRERDKIVKSGAYKWPLRELLDGYEYLLVL